MTTGTWIDGVASGMKYKILMPPGYDSTKGPYPLVFYMHQLDLGIPSNWAFLIGQLNTWFNPGAVRDRHPCIVLAVLLDQTADRGGTRINFGGVSASITAGRDQALSCLAQVCATYPIDANRIFPTGNSLGGIGTWEMIAYRPDLFACAMPLAGASYSRDPVATANALRNKPIWAIHGGQDRSVPLLWDRAVAARMKANGSATFKYTEDPARGHDVWDYYYPRADVWDWAFAQSLSGAVVQPPVVEPAKPFVPASPTSPNNTQVDASGKLIDSIGHTWSISADARVALDGVAYASTANVVALAWCGGVIWQKNAAGKWYAAQGGGTWSAGTPTSPMPDEPPPAWPISPDNTQVAGGGSLIDSDGHTWTITADERVATDGVPDASTNNVVALAWCGGVLWQQNRIGKWYASKDGRWLPGTFTSPMPKAPTTAGTGTGKFYVAGGKIIDPDGNEFLGVGVNINDWQMAVVATDDNCEPLLKFFPGLTMLRIACRQYSEPDYYREFIRKLTAKKIVLKFEDHTGISKPPYVGPQLTAEVQWYGNLAAAFKDNPYVWFGGFNEPGKGVALWLIQAQNVAIYNAIRVSSKTIFALSLPSGGNRGLVGPNARGYDGSIMGDLDMCKQMTSVIWDLHNYGWLSNYDTDPAVIRAVMLGIPPAPAATGAAAAQLWLSADGVIPVMIGEFGNSTTGKGIDANGIALCKVTGEAARKRETAGFQAWHWNAAGDQYEDQLVSDAGQLTSLGKLVASLIVDATRG